MKISPALTDLSRLLHDGEAFIYYFKEVEKIITTVIPHLMCPEPPITLWPAAVWAEYRKWELSSSCSKKREREGHKSFFLCTRNNKTHLQTPSSCSIMAYPPVFLLIWLMISVVVLHLPLRRRPKHCRDIREGSFLRSLVLLISSLITGHYSWVSAASPLCRTFDATLLMQNKQLNIKGAHLWMRSVSFFLFYRENITSTHLHQAWLE